MKSQNKKAVDSNWSKLLADINIVEEAIENSENAKPFTLNQFNKHSLLVYELFALFIEDKL